MIRDPFVWRIVGTVAVLLVVFVGIPAAWRAVNRRVNRRIQSELDAAQRYPLPWEPMASHEPESQVWS